VLTKDRQSAEREIKQLLDRIRRLEGKRVVTVDGKLVTAFHISRREECRLLRRSDEAWLTLKSVGNKTVKPDELARVVLRLAMEGERDPIRLSHGALEGLVPATTWCEAS
jgi:hypothetical protein